MRVIGGIHAQRFKGVGDHGGKEEAAEDPEGEAGSEYVGSKIRALRLGEGNQPICGRRVVA